MGKEGVSEGEGEGAHTPPFEGERERDIDPHTHTHTRTILLTADRLNQHTLYESKYVCRRENVKPSVREESGTGARTHTPPLAVPGAMMCWRYTPPLLRSQKERERERSARVWYALESTNL